MTFYRIQNEEREVFASCHSREDAELELAYQLEKYPGSKLEIVEHEGQDNRW